MGRLNFQGRAGEKQLNEECSVLPYGTRSRLFSKQPTDRPLSILARCHPRPQQQSLVPVTRHRTLITCSCQSLKWAPMSWPSGPAPDLWPTTTLPTFSSLVSGFTDAKKTHTSLIQRVGSSELNKRKFPLQYLQGNTINKWTSKKLLEEGGHLTRLK